MISGRKQRVLITGASGYVGGRLVRHLAANAVFDVVMGSRVESRCPTGSWPRVVTDYTSVAALHEACTGIDAIVHLAGANAQTCAADPAGALEANAVATARLVSAAAASGVRRLIYVSTAHVYGSPLLGRITEETCPRSTHPYATSHRAGEDSVLYARARGQIDGVVVRLTNAFGAPADVAADCWMLLVTDLCRQAADTGRMELNSSGLQRRDFIPLNDACAAFAHLLTLESTGDGLFNVGGEWAPTVRDMATRIAALCPRVLGRTVSLETRPAASGERSEDLDVRIDRLRGTTFVPRRDIDAELAATLEFCVMHRAVAGVAI